jgi:hypothetical protein
MTVGHAKPAEERIVKYVNPGPTPPAMSCRALQLTAQRVPDAVVVELRYVMWLP